MSIKMAAAKLSATAAGVALMTGGAVRVAEPMVTDDPVYGTDVADGKVQAPVRQTKYIKDRDREIPPPRKKRIVERTIECQPMPAGAVDATDMLPTDVTDAKFDDEKCPPVAQIAYVPAPLPPLPPVRGGGGGGPIVISGGLGGFGGGFGGGFFGGFFGGGGSSSGNVTVSTTTSGGEGASVGDIKINIDNSTSTGQVSTSTGEVSTSTGSVSTSTGKVSTTTTTGSVSTSTGEVSTSTSTSTSSSTSSSTSTSTSTSTSSSTSTSTSGAVTTKPGKRGGHKVPAPPMMILFGLAAAAVLGRRKFGAQEPEEA